MICLVIGIREREGEDQEWNENGDNSKYGFSRHGSVPFDEQTIMSDAEMF
jgi:hypothetical protein